MREDPHSDEEPFETRAKDVVAVVVSYNPGVEFEPLLVSLAEQCGAVVVVDNASAAEPIEMIRRTCRSVGARLIENERNLGIAAAQNQGIRRARELGAGFVLLSDDDSTPPRGMTGRLRQAFRTGAGRTRLAAVGPRVGQRSEQGADDLVYVDRGWGPKRATEDELEHPLLPVAFLIASGCMISMSALDRIGLMNEDFFIDHVDLEWGLRARRAGYELAVLSDCRMEHRLGDETVKVPGRAQVVHLHGPIRNYYLVRNTIALQRSGLMTWGWTLGYAVWLAKYAGFNMLVPADRGERVRRILKGFSDGLLGRSGPFR